MKITRIRTRVVDLPLPQEFHPAWARGRNQPNIILVVIEVETDVGITGIGAAHAGAEAAIAIERFVTPYLLGQDPTRIELLTKSCAMRRYWGRPSTAWRSRCGISSANSPTCPSTSSGAVTPIG